MKIGLMTIYQVPNYGSVLQAFATQYILEQLGVSCDIIKYRYPNKWHWKNGAKRPNRLRSFIRNIFPSKKVKVLNQFRNEYLKFSKSFNSLKDLENANWNDYDAFLVGSDQVWNSRFVLGDSAFMLSFVPKGKPRYSLSSSFALNSLPERFREKYKKELELFSAISVREKNGIKILNDELHINKPISIILDPTLLLNKEDWMKAIPRSNFKKKRPYILFYMWTYAFEPRPYIFDVVKYFQEKNGYDVIAIEGYTRPEEAKGIVMENRTNSTIPEFIDYFVNADLVITSSFHGTAFALNFGIPLISIVQNGNGDDRQTSLLKSVGCEFCAVNIGADYTTIAYSYDIEEEQIKIKKIQQDNISWIKRTIIKKNDSKNN